VKKQARRLALNRETLLQLTDPAMVRLQGGLVFQNVNQLPISQIPNCTSPLCMETMCQCPVGTVVVAGTVAAD
jgi:hypothetical protein